MSYHATNFPAESRGVDLARSGPCRGSTHGSDWSGVAAAASPMHSTLMNSTLLCLFCSLSCRGENSELACCNMESTVVGAMWGAGSEESISRTLGDGVRIAYHLHAYDNSINQSAVVVNSVLEFGTHARSSAT